MSDKALEVRKLSTQAEEIRAAVGRGDDGGPLRKVAACAVGTSLADVTGRRP